MFGMYDKFLLLFFFFFLIISRSLLVFTPCICFMCVCVLLGEKSFSLSFRF